MRITIDLPDELVRELKLRAVMEGRSVEALVTECLIERLGARPTAAAKPTSLNDRVKLDSSGLPSFRCEPNAPAARMSVSELLQLEEEIPFGEAVVELLDRRSDEFQKNPQSAVTWEEFKRRIGKS